MSKYCDMVSKMKKAPIYIELDELDLYCELLLNDTNKTLNYSNLANLREYIDFMDTEVIHNDDAKMARYVFIDAYLKARLVNGITSRKLIINFIKDNVDRRYLDIIDREIFYNIEQDNLSSKDIKYVNDMIYANVSLKFIHTYKVGMSALIEDINDEKFTKSAESCNDAIQFLQSLLSELTKAQRRSRQDNRMNLLDTDVFESMLYESAEKLLSDSDYLVTNWQGINKLLGGGFANGRIYNFIGATGGFKSGLLLNIMKTLKLANKGRAHKDPTKRPTILFVSQENNIWETVHRIFNIFSTTESIKNYTPKQIVKMIKDGGFKICEDESDINVEFRFGGNMDYSVDDLRGMVEELDNSGQEVIAIIQDYVERLRPPNMRAETRVRLIDVSNQLHDLAMDLDIPIITGSQLNKDGNGIIEDMRKSNSDKGKVSDIGKNIGSKYISESFGMLKNFDYNLAIVIEYDHNEERYYLSMNKLKERGASGGEKLSFILHPFVGRNSNIQLMDDTDPDQPLYRLTLTDSMSPEAEEAAKECKKPKKVKDIGDPLSMVKGTVSCGTTSNSAPDNIDLPKSFTDNMSIDETPKPRRGRKKKVEREEVHLNVKRSSPHYDRLVRSGIIVNHDSDEPVTKNVYTLMPKPNSKYHDFLLREEARALSM